MLLAVVLFLCIFMLLLYLETRKPKNYPPGPSWLPVVGSVAVFKQRRHMKYLYKATISLAEEHSPEKRVLGLKVGKDLIVVVCGYESIKEMLLNEDVDGRPRGPFYETRTWGERRGVLLTDEEFWQEQRRFVARHLKEFGFGRRAMAELIQEEAEQVLLEFKSKVGSGSMILPMHDAFYVYVLNTLWSMMAGIRYTVHDKELMKLQNLLSELFANIDMVGCLFSQFPVLRFLAPELSGYKRFIKIHSQIWEFLKEELDKHKRDLKSNDEPRDFMDVYLKMIATSKEKSTFSEKQLLAICMDMFMAGSETTSKGLGFMFLYLVRNPDKQRKAQEEIDRVIGRNRLPTLDDRPRMPYCEALVMETIRLFMGRTFGIPHRALRDTTLCGFDIPKDTMVIANFNGMLMSNKYWEDPEAFRPERFLDPSTGTLLHPNHEFYLPFGIGRHRCMGELMARSNTFLFTVTLLQSYTFDVPPGQDLPSEDAVDGATPGVQPFDALVAYREVK